MMLLWVMRVCVMNARYVAGHMLHVTRHTSHVIRNAGKQQMRLLQFQLSRGNSGAVYLHFTRHTSHVTRHTSRVTRHTSHVTRHTSHVTRHTSLVTRHTSHVTRCSGAGRRLQPAQQARIERYIETPNPKPQTRNRHPQTPNPKPETPNRKQGHSGHKGCRAAANR